MFFNRDIEQFSNEDVHTWKLDDFLPTDFMQLSHTYQTTSSF